MSDWTNIQTEDLSPSGLVSLFSTARRRGLVSGSTDDAVTFTELAAHACRVGERPAALFRYLVEHKRFDTISLEDERNAATLRRELRNEIDQHERMRITGRSCSRVVETSEEQASVFGGVNQGEATKPMRSGKIGMPPRRQRKRAATACGGSAAAGQGPKRCGKSTLRVGSG